MKPLALLSAAVPLLFPILASALVIDKPTFSLTFDSDWFEGFVLDPSVPFHTVGDTVHDAAGYLQGMPVTASTPANQYFDNVTLSLAAQYVRTDSSEKRLGSYLFKTSGWREREPEDEESVEIRRLYTLDEGGVAFFAWMSYEPGGEAALAEFEAALATLRIKGVGVRDRRFRPGTAAAPSGSARLDLLGRARTTASRLPAGHYVLRAR